MFSMMLALALLGQPSEQAGEVVLSPPVYTTTEPYLPPYGAPYGGQYPSYRSYLYPFGYPPYLLNGYAYPYRTYYPYQIPTYRHGHH